MRTKDDTLELAEKIIMQSQYSELDKQKPDRLFPQAMRISPSDVTCLFRITELVYNRTEDTLKKLTTILNSLHSCGASAVLLIQCQNGECELYFGAVNKQRYDNVFYLNTIRDILRNGIEGNLPGTVIQELFSKKEIEETLTRCVDNGFDSQCITAISCVSGDREDDSVPPDGIERLFEAIGNKNFSIVLLADPVSSEKILEIRQGYEQIGSNLSSVEQNSVAVQSGKSTTISTNYSVSMSKSIGKNISMTQSHTEGSGWSRGMDTAANRGGKLLSAGAGLISKDYIAMNAMSLLLNRPAESQSGHSDESRGVQIGGNINEQTGEQQGEGKSFADSEGITYSYASKDYHIKSLMERIDWYLQWLNRRENYGMFNCCAYVISSSAGTNMMVASEYQALMQGKRDMNQPVTFNTWTRENSVEIIREYLKHLSHPSFSLGSGQSSFTPAMLMSSKELSRHLAFPQNSVLGVSVSEYASFGRNIVRKSTLKSGKLLRIGDVQHMGKALTNQPVLLDLQSLASHTFIAGTNGSGKSNAVFKILEELMRAEIPFLVIEPAKGEYKNVFGREKNVSVYGTNEKKANLLRLNPFWFNDDVNVLEHIDKLVEVFNASWSMYAAMPAVLKAAIENAYRSCGWDLEDSSCAGSVKIFPTFEDVIAEFNQKMDATAFSQEVKGNYVGALSTRMETMCNGIYGRIFGGNNLSDEELFDANVIIDLSRVGSMETKSMIMGMLVIRLQEYRMRNEAMNLPLRHITILEEAHHLLRRTSAAQSDEGSNMLGKSVEMISNAIAEMRSFGEGFIIVDQSPGLLDMSVMRNTNTKIILRLPESGDREIVGNTIGLKPEQMFEISRFGTGVSVIYQKDWREAVLCKVDRAAHEEILYTPDRAAARQNNHSALIRTLLEACGLPVGLTEEEREAAKQSIPSCGLSGGEKKKILGVLHENACGPLANVSAVICRLCAASLPLPPSPSAADAKAWYHQYAKDESLTRLYNEKCLRGILMARLEEAAKKEPLYYAAMAELPSLSDRADGALKSARGTAFRRITPLSFKLDSGTGGQEQLDRALDILSKAGDADRELADLLKTHMQNGDVRQCRVIVPYAGLVWKLFSGETLWETTKALIDKRDAAAWDAAARKWLRCFMTADKATESSVLSLFLQNKGKNEAVRLFYPEWSRTAMAPEKENALPIANLGEK